jgi:hypothetical protein
MPAVADGSGVIAKPYNPDALLQAVNGVLKS